MKKSVYMMLTLGLLCGCTAGKLQFDQEGLQALKGQPEALVIKELGQPDKNFVKGNTTYLIYATTYETFTPPESEPYLDPGALPEFGFPGMMGYYTPEACITTFMIQNQIVQKVTTLGNCL